MNLNSTESTQIRRFGIIAFLFFGCLCGFGLLAGKALPVYLFGLLSILGFGFLIFPIKLRPLYVAWMKIARILGRIINTSVLTIAYYFVITPSAFIKRLIGGRPLPLRPNKYASSYWVARSEPVQPKERFFKRF